MKESVTQFDLEAAFKELDAIEIPKAQKGIAANRTNIKEAFNTNRRLASEALLEDYFDISNQNELEQAKAAREAEIAKAKLTRIEKIVDLDADSEEDLLPSYVGKVIIQCPQCMTLFYKNAADINVSEEDDSVVNIGETCQHCGNESGYNVIGKVDSVDTTEIETNNTNIEDTKEENDTDINLAAADETAEAEDGVDDETASDNDITDNTKLTDFDLSVFEPGANTDADNAVSDVQTDSDTSNAEEDRQSKAKKKKKDEVVEEGLTAEGDSQEHSPAAPEKTQSVIKENIEDGLDTVDVVLETDDLVEYTSDYATIVVNKDAFDNFVLKATINIQFDGDPAVNTYVMIDESEDGITMVNLAEYNKTNQEQLQESTKQKKPTPDELLNEGIADEVSQQEWEELLNSDEFQEPISDAEVQGYIAADQAETKAQDVETEEVIENYDQFVDYKEDTLKNFDDAVDSIQNIDEKSLEHVITESLLDVYSNVSEFKLTNCTATEDHHLILEGVANLKSGEQKRLSYAVNSINRLSPDKLVLLAENKTLANDGNLTFTCALKNNNLITESLNYTLHIDNKDISGIVKNK